ncbi:MAG: phosphotransferase, partial [Clostridia bacterium]|nr:phosphotransferase [Clostridia bacterium]
EVLGEGAFGTVYRLDEDTVVKVYRNGEKSLPIIKNEQEKARQAFLSGIPTAIPVDIVQVGDQYGSMFEMINAQNCNEIIVRDPGQLPGMISEYAAFLKKLHSLETKPGELESARDIYLRNLTVFGDVLPAAIRERLEALLRKMPDDYHLIHGDIQMKNVMKSGDEMVLIDMDKICTGNPVFEFASLYTTYVLFSEDNPMDNEQFLGISRETADRIYYETLQCYLDHPEESDLTETQRRIRLAAYLRFMTILMIEMKDVQSELRTIRIRHTIEHLKELTFEVDELQI